MFFTIFLTTCNLVFLTKKTSTTMFHLTNINIAFVRVDEHPLHIIQQDDKSIETKKGK